ncbi:hypothetical protein M3Y94_00526500 [Aphelenchoides besseyi]|nr:hypothetical protein M3Y94_00526500 [Aphelenchoides besseyi]
MVQPPTTSGYYTQDSDCPTKRPTENDDDRSVQGQNENATNCFGMPLGAWLIVIAYTSIVCSVICAVGAILQLQMHSIFTRSYNIWPTTIYTYFLWFVFVVNVIFCVASSCLCADGRFGSRYCRLFFLVYGPVELLVSFGDIISCIVYVAAPKLFKAEDNLYPGIILSNSTIIFLYIMYVVALAVFLWQVWRARNMDPTGEERTRNWAIASRWIDRHTGSARVYHHHCY